MCEDVHLSEGGGSIQFTLLPASRVCGFGPCSTFIGASVGNRGQCFHPCNTSFWKLAPQQFGKDRTRVLKLSTPANIYPAGSCKKLSASIFYNFDMAIWMKWFGPI